MTPKLVKIIMGLLITVCTATAGAVTYFAKASYAEETRQLVMQLTDKQQLKWLMSEYNEFTLVCTNKLTDEWVCSDSKKRRYDEMLVEINILRKSLGLEQLEEE